MRFAGTREGQILGRPVPQLLFESVQTGKVINVIYPPRDARGRELKGDPKILEVLRNIKVGDIVVLKANELNGQHVLTSLDIYKPKAGEEEPGVFVIRKRGTTKIGNFNYANVTVSKYFQEATVLLPYTKGLGNNMILDANMSAQLAEFHEGDLAFVQVEAMGNQLVLRGIQKYEPPIEGEMVRFVPASPKDPNSFPCVEIKTSGGTETLRIPGTKNSYGRFSPDSSMVSYMSALKPGQSLDFRMRSDDAGKFLRWCRSSVERPKYLAVKSSETTGSPGLKS